MSDSLRPYGLQHTRLPCPPLSQEFAQVHVHWVIVMSITIVMLSNHLILCHPLLLLLSSNFSASGLFPTSQLFSSGVQSIEASALASVLPMNIQGWFPLGLTRNPENHILPVPSPFHLTPSRGLIQAPWRSRWWLELGGQGSFFSSHSVLFLGSFPHIIYGWQFHLWVQILVLIPRTPA